MSDSVALIKANPLLPAEDYPALRKQGIHDIEKTGSDIWTNYNFSDPGITILEAVTYAITDLAYRTGFDMKDLLAPETLSADTWKQIFYTAKQILHNSPLTIDDYRKLIIDIKGVRNAWITPSKDYEVPVWIDYNTYDWRKDAQCSCKDDHEKFCIGKLGLNPVDPLGYKAEWEKKIIVLKKTLQDLQAQLAALDKAIEDARAKVKASGGTDKDILKALADAIQKKEDFVSKNEKTREQTIMELHFISRAPYPSKVVEFEGLYNVMVEYEEDVPDDDDREKIRQQIIDRLSHHRNLCEDVLSVNAVEYEDFGIGASFILEEYADADTVLAQVFFAIYKYFTPSVPFHTIDQMLEKGYLVDEIFEGPALKHGFVDNAELEATDFYRDIHLSDLINIIADIPGIKAITYLHLPFKGFKKDTSHLYFNKWIDFLRRERKIARIQPSLSQVIFCKAHDFTTYYVGGDHDRRPDRMLKLFKDLKTLERKYKLEGVVTDFPIPAGEYMNLEDYYPVTYSLPICYGVNDKAGLPANADQKRQVQALQLKGYLLFFEQIMADYLVQLNHLRDLFSFDDNIKYTYFSRALTEMADLKDLLIDYGNHGKDHFDLILKDFTAALQNIVEGPDIFYKRRNRFFNHFLARFSEDLSEYEALMRWLAPTKVEDRLIHDKARILKDGEYYRISSNRGLGYNYASSNYWDSPNVSGTERRVGRLLGLTDVTRRSLFPSYFVSTPIFETDEKTHLPVQKKDKLGNPLNSITLYDPDNKQVILLTSVDVKDGCCTELLMNQILEHADDRRFFKFREELKQKARKTSSNLGTFWFELYDDTNPDEAVLIATGEKFDTKEKMEDAFKRLQQVMQQINNNEGFHLVEHILLRPKMDIVYDELNQPVEVKFLDICLDTCDRGIGENEGVEVPLYRIKITRIPPEKCYDNMPWVLEYLEIDKTKTTHAIDHSFLFQQVFTDATPPVNMKFRQYELLTQRIRDLREFGSERINYEIVSNNATDPTKLKYGFIIHHGEHGTVLTQSLYQYNKKDPNSKTPVTDDVEAAIRDLMHYFGYELDLYCQEDPCDNDEDPYSFRATMVIPCWPKRFRDPTFRGLVEKTIQTESPAHVDIRVVWVDILEMERFEKVFKDWLKEMSQTEMPDYGIVNPLVEVLNTLKPCGVCDDDCGQGTKMPTNIRRIPNG